MPVIQPQAPEGGPGQGVQGKPGSALREDGLIQAYVPLQQPGRCVAAQTAQAETKNRRRGQSEAKSWHTHSGHKAGLFLQADVVSLWH